jgi:hypothetical protein
MRSDTSGGAQTVDPKFYRALLATHETVPWHVAAAAFSSLLNVPAGVSSHDALLLAGGRLRLPHARIATWVLSTLHGCRSWATTLHLYSMLRRAEHATAHAPSSKDQLVLGPQQQAAASTALRIAPPSSVPLDDRSAMASAIADRCPSAVTLINALQLALTHDSETRRATATGEAEARRIATQCATRYLRYFKPQRHASLMPLFDDAAADSGGKEVRQRHVAQDSTQWRSAVLLLETFSHRLVAEAVGGTGWHAQNNSVDCQSAAEFAAAVLLQKMRQWQPQNSESEDRDLGSLMVSSRTNTALPPRWLTSATSVESIVLHAAIAVGA